MAASEWERGRMGKKVERHFFTFSFYLKYPLARKKEKTHLAITNTYLDASFCLNKGPTKNGKSFYQLFPIKKTCTVCRKKQNW